MWNLRSQQNPNWDAVNAKHQEIFTLKTELMKKAQAAGIAGYGYGYAVAAAEAWAVAWVWAEGAEAVSKSLPGKTGYNQFSGCRWDSR